jgi:hypothetical protein
MLKGLWPEALAEAEKASDLDAGKDPDVEKTLARAKRGP